ncbi:hypothetical protein FGIG_07589 [Fasciola gigantica]|uniref:Uncharacterized protein n=1 Tax=Fasciola gigantica TaxID=46835 RepID=A0A504YII5_FASGI|nr:hypothetical protein FGIG_07589 [Fasciola gigantica]
MHKLGTNPAEYCKRIMEENQNQLSTRFNPVDDAEFINEYLEPVKEIGSDVKQLSPPADMQTITHALPVGPDEPHSGEKANIGPMGPQPAVFPHSPRDGPMPPLRPDGPVGPQPAGPSHNEPGPIDLPFGPGPERPSDVVAQPARGPEGSALFDFQREHPEGPRPLMEGMLPPHRSPQEGLMPPPPPPPSLPLGPQPPLGPQRDAGSTPKVGPDYPSRDSSSPKDRTSEGKQKPKKDRNDLASDSGSLFSSLPKSSGSGKSASRSKRINYNTRSLMDRILKKFSRKDETKKSEKTKKSKKVHKKRTTVGKKTHIKYDTPLLFHLNEFDSPSFWSQKNGPHDMYVKPMPPPHMMGGHHPEELHGPFLMMDHFGEAGLPHSSDGLFHPLDMEERGWTGYGPGERWLPMDREFEPIPRNSLHVMGPQGTEFLGPRGFPEPFRGYPMPGIPLLDPEGLVPVKQTVQTDGNQTKIHGSPAEEGTGTGSDIDPSEPHFLAVPEKEGQKFLDQVIIQKISSKGNSNQNTGSKYGRPMSRPYYSYHTMPESLKSPREELLRRLRLLRIEARYWKKKYESCTGYRSKIRSALYGEIHRPKNAGLSIRRLSVTGLTVLFVADWLRRWL